MQRCTKTSALAPGLQRGQEIAAFFTLLRVRLAPCNRLGLLAVPKAKDVCEAASFSSHYQPFFPLSACAQCSKDGGPAMQAHFKLQFWNAVVNFFYFFFIFPEEQWTHLVQEWCSLRKWNVYGAGKSLFHKKTWYINTQCSIGHIFVSRMRNLCEWRKVQVFLLAPKKHNPEFISDGLWEFIGISNRVHVVCHKVKPVHWWFTSSVCRCYCNL